MLTNSQYQLNPQTKSHIINYTSLQGKTRMDSLIERIHSANKEINNILETSTKPKKAVKIEKEKKTNNNNNTEAKPPQTLNEIITQDNNDNNKSVQVGLDENLNNENIFFFGSFSSIDLSVILNSLFIILGTTFIFANVFSLKYSPVSLYY